MMNKVRIITFLFTGIISLFWFLPSTYAVEFKTGDTLLFAKGEKVNETVVASGKQITVDADINGDLHCLGQTVVINGDIKGDVLCAAQTIKIIGSVDGNVRVAAQMVDIEGSISRNLNVLAQSLTLAHKSSVKGDILFGAQTIDLSGTAGRDLTGIGESIVITGSLLRNAVVNIKDLNVTNTASIKGNLDYYTTGTEGIATISSKVVMGNVVRHDIPVQKSVPSKPKEVKPMSYSAILTATLLGAIAFFILACAFIYFDKSRTERITNTIQEKPVISILIGLAVMITFPFAFFLLFITFIGMPLAFVGLLIYIAAIIGSSTYTSIVIGWNLVKLIKKEKHPNSILSALVGIIVLGLLITLPFIGWIFGALALLAGLGAFFVSYLPEKA